MVSADFPTPFFPKITSLIWDMLTLLESLVRLSNKRVRKGLELLGILDLGNVSQGYSCGEWNLQQEGFHAIYFMRGKKPHN